MANEYYNHGGAPSQGSNGTSGVIRAEFDSIVVGMGKLPPLAGNASKFVIVNAGSTAMGVASYTPAAAGVNNDITSITGLTTALSPAQGGTGATSNASAPFALKGANADITQLTGITTALTISQGGTGQVTGSAALVGLGERTSQTGSVVSPAGTTAQRDGAPAAGYFRYNSTNDAFEGYLAAGWGSIGGGATGATGEKVFVETNQTVNNSYTLTANFNAMTAGPVTIGNAAIITIPTGATWSIV